jgi:hypothetical protein
MKKLSSKYSRGNLRNKWKVQQCQCERKYFGYEKDCEKCEGREYCYSEEFQPYYVNVASSVLVFADSFDNAREYAGKGHGWVLDKEIVSGLPVELNVSRNLITFKAAED